LKILLVEDYGPLRLAVAQTLREEGFTVDDTADGEEGLWLAREHSYALVVLDLTLPNLDGMELLKRIRGGGDHTAVMIMTSRDAVGDRVAGLNEGADDYLVKPFAIDELVARVHALVRRSHDYHAPVIKIGDLEIDTTARTTRLAGEEMEVTAKEFALLEMLALKIGSVVSRDRLSDGLYDHAHEVESNVLEVFVARLRKKLEAGGRPRLIHTRRGEGYMMKHPR
jgi:two-component system response regulator PhoP